MTIYNGNGMIIGIGVIECVLLILWLALVVCLVVAYFMSIKCLVDAALAKTEKPGRGKLWFIGLFATPIVLGLIVCVLKDEKGAKAAARVAQPTLQIPASPMAGQAMAASQAPTEGSAPAGE